MLHGPLVEVDLWESLVHFVKLQLVLPLLNICIGSWMLRDWLAAAFLCTVFLLVLRLVSVEVLLFALPAVGYALLLPAVGSALCLARCWLCHSLFISSLLQIFVFFSLSSYQCCFTSFFSSFHHWLVGLWSCLGFSPLAPWLWFRLCFFFRVTFVVCYDSVARFWLTPNITTQHCALRD